jgi:hypothetical protein
MRWYHQMRLWARSIFKRSRVEQELEKELQSHLSLLIEERIRSGMSEAAARRAAALDFGGIAQLKELMRDERNGAKLESLYQDVRIAIRVLLKKPTILLLTVSTVGIGIGAMTAISSISRTLLITLITVTGGMVLTAIGASYWPARTVTHQVPASLLKNE